MFKIYSFEVLIDGIKKQVSFFETNEIDANKRINKIIENNKNIKLKKHSAVSLQ